AKTAALVVNERPLRLVSSFCRPLLSLTRRSFSFLWKWDRRTEVRQEGSPPAAVVIFPIISTLISALCAIVIAQDAKRKPRPDKMAWVVAFALFAIASLCDVIGSVSEWTPFLVRTYYLT